MPSGNMNSEETMHARMVNLFYELQIQIEEELCMRALGRKIFFAE